MWLNMSDSDYPFLRMWRERKMKKTSESIVDEVTRKRLDTPKVEPEKEESFKGAREHKHTGIPLVETGVQYILKGLHEEFGLDINNENFRETPKRVARAYYEIFEGINCEDEIKNIAEKSFPSEYGGMIMEKDIRVFSMCPHHFLPVEYVVSIAYIPDKKTVGISKLARITEILSKQPELQEMFTEKLSHLLYTELGALGVMVLVKGRHMCMVMRGVKKDSWTITASIKGRFEEDPAARAEFLAYANQH